MIPKEPQIVVYPVGWLAAWQHRKMPGKLRSEWRHFRRRLRERDWNATRNSFNGYLAEAQYTSMRHYRCGHGWTKRRALSDLGRHLGEINQ